MNYKEITYHNLNYKDLIIFLIPCLIFLYYLHVYNPGILTYDSFNQLHQIAENNYNNWQPFFHTFIEMICIKIYPSPMTICILQIFTFSTVWMIICRYFRKQMQFKLQVILTLLICLIPINAVYSITLWKDILFSYAMLFLCFLIKLIIDRKFEISLPLALVLSSTMAFISQIRPNGIYIILILLVILSIYFYKKNKPQKMFIIIPVATIIIILLISSLSIVYDVEDTHKDAVFAKTSHLLADYDLNLDLSESDREKIHEMINESTIQSKYNIYFTDPIRDNANQEVWNNNKQTYISMAINYSFKNPLHFIYYMFESADIVWDITRDDEWPGPVYYFNIHENHIDENKNSFYSAINETAIADFENVTGINDNTTEYKIVNLFVLRTSVVKVLDTLFESPALYMYLAFIAMIAIFLITQSKSIFLVYLPNMLNILTIFISTPTQDVRYLYPNLLVFYLLLLILIGLYQKKEISLKKIIKQTINSYLKLN